MTHSLFSLRTLALAVGLALSLPAAADHHGFTYRRDLDHDGHYNTKHVDWGHHGHYYGGHGYYGHGYYGGYYGGGYYPYYGYGYGYPYYYGPRVGVTIYRGPSSGYSYAERDDDTAADVQRALKRRGYYHGSVDGVIGPESRNAIRNFQADKRLNASGRIDRDTLRELDLD